MDSLTEKVAADLLRADGVAMIAGSRDGRSAAGEASAGQDGADGFPLL